MKSRTRVNSKSGKMGLILAAAPVVIELLVAARNGQKKRGKYTRARKRDRVIDSLLSGAQRAVGRGGKRRWF
ncbi:hypothetical protein GCM10008956_16160 [Deinococcus arenae]|uniref:Uncharacterized protein n=1 Tax=Deinococcus arenae TaxID=1452751 RepID=A0A8H9GP01_9DEIO|nr:MULTISPECIES: hypothetical protein [Deinococcus]AWT36343.1 hypothetical protein DM785_12810 [Deinococcus actinosclerus]GGM40459.1 hypothetical protein GCM10008956_16160 [Deinococcus arenae]